MPAVTIDGYKLTAIAIVCFLILLLAVLATRMLRDHGVRVAKIGLFVERERISEPKRPEETHTVDPADPDTKIEWPQREEA